MKHKVSRLPCVVLVIAMIMGLTQPSAFADSIQAKDVAQAYKSIIESTASESRFVIDNLYGDDIPELIVDSEIPNGDDLQIWSCRNGTAELIGTILWDGYSVIHHALYATKDGKLAWIVSQSPSGVTYEPYTEEYRAGTVYTLNDKGKLEVSESYEYYYDAYKDREVFTSGTINGEASTAEKVQNAHSSLTNNLSTLILSNRSYETSQAMTKSEAEVYLYKITGRFWDVPAGQYYTEAVEWAVNENITSGTGTVYFSPDSSCNRAQAVTFLWRAAGSPKVDGATGFSDVPENAFYADAVKWAVRNNITSGAGDGKFNPEGICSRAQIVTFIYRAAGSPQTDGSSGFSDVPDNAFYANAVNWAVKNNITTGTGNGKFGSDDPCTRGQIVTFLYQSRDIPIDPQPIKGWSEVYEDFVMQHRFLNTDQEYTFGESSSFSGFLVYLYDMDQDGTPELSISNGETGRATRRTHIYTCVNGQTVYLGIGPTNAAYDPGNRTGLMGVFRDGAYMSVTRYLKSGTSLTNETIATYDNFEGDSDSFATSLIYLNQTDVASIQSIGWQEFLSTQLIS